MPIAMDNSKDSPRRNKPMCTMDVEAATMQTLPNGFLVLPGKSTIKIYEDQVDEVMALVRDEDENLAIIRAKEEYDRRFKKYADEKCDGDAKVAYERFPQSVESVYCQQNEGKGVYGTRPLLSAVIKEKGLPPPQKEDSWDAQNSSAEMVAKTINIILENKELRKHLAKELRDEIFEEEDEQAKSKGKRN